jgi:hypothetical protein
VQLAIYFIVRECLKEFISIMKYVLRAISEGKRFLLPVNEEAVFTLLEEGAVSGGGSRFWRKEPFLEEGAVSGGGSRFWRRKPFLEEKAVSVSVEGEGSRL